MNREIPAHIIAEDAEFLAFLDIRPIRAGHALVVPKVEIDDLFDLPEPLLSGILGFARPVAHAIRKASGASRVGLAVVGFEIPHSHLHLVPIDAISDLDFRNAHPADESDLAEMANRIRAAFDDASGKGGP